MVPFLTNKRGCSVPLKRRRSAGVVELPKGVHRVVARGKEYLYWHPGRGTKHAGQRVRLPADSQTPEFWVALREAQSGSTAAVTTFGMVLDLYLTSPAFLGLGEGTRDQYTRQIKTARAGFGNLPADAMRPSLIMGVLDGLADRPGTANNFLTAMRAVSAWGRGRDHFKASITEGVKPYDKKGGHKPWTDAQIEAARQHLTGYVRRAILLGLYTGQRGSDLVRMGWTDIDDGGFRIVQKKTGREIWCPIVDELAAEMATWDKRPGPFVRQDSGKPFTRKLLSKHYNAARLGVSELRGASIHGLRATAVVRLRRQGLTTAQIQDIIGMSMAMIERYSRFADKKASGKAAVISLEERARNRNRG
jgi:integrase